MGHPDGDYEARIKIQCGQRMIEFIFCIILPVNIKIPPLLEPFQPFAIAFHHGGYCPDVSMSIAYFFIAFVVCPVGFFLFPLMAHLFLCGSFLLLIFASLHAMWFCFGKEEDNELCQ